MAVEVRPPFQVESGIAVLLQFQSAPIAWVVDMGVIHGQYQHTICVLSRKYAINVKITGDFQDNDGVDFVQGFIRQLQYVS